MKTQTIAQSLSKLAIVRAAFAFLNLGEDGKIESFINKVIRTLNNEVKVLKQNITQKTFIYEHEVEALQEQILDAKDASDQALIDINVDKLSTNQSQTEYIDTYLGNIDDKYTAVTRLEEKLLKLEEAHKLDLEDLEKQVASTEKRIALLSATV